MGGVIGNYGTLSLCIFFFKGFNLIFFHINGTEAEINLLCDFLNISRCIEKNHILHAFRHGNSHFPAAACCLFISLTCTSGRSGENLYIKPRVIFKKNCKSLSNHARSTYNSDIVLFHNTYSLIKIS